MGYSDVVLADAPLAYWRQSEAAAATVMVDASPNARDGTFENTGSLTYQRPSLITTDATNKAIRYNGGGRGRVAYGSWMNSRSLTVEAWVNVTALTGVQTIALRRASFANVFQFRINAGKPEIVYWTNIGVGTVTAPAALSLGKHHLVWTFKEALPAGGGNPNEYVRLYADGAQVIQQQHGAPGGSWLDTTQTTALYVGYNGGGDNEVPNNLDLDEVAVYPTELSAARVDAHYKAATVAGLPIYLGTAQASAMYLGTAPVSSLRLGTSVVF